MPEDNPLYRKQEVALANASANVNVVAINNNQTWMKWVGALLMRFVYATIKFVPF
jgi:hypothetical protein